jgi:DHA2 family lincomycin resistance protein-like MFS transporter
MVSLFSAKKNGYLTDVANDLPAAAASGSSLVFKISLIFAIVNVVLSLFMKKPK